MEYLLGYKNGREIMLTVYGSGDHSERIGIKVERQFVSGAMARGTLTDFDRGYADAKLDAVGH